MSETVVILSTGAPKTGVSRSAEAFRDATGTGFEVSFVTAPVLQGKVAAGEDGADMVVAPVAALQGFEAERRTVAGTSVVVGSVKAAVVVRDGATAPDLSSAATLKQAILDAGSVVYNTATSGLYIEQMMERLGVAEAIRGKTVRVANGAAVMAHLAASRIENEIGFGQATEIRLHGDRGVTLVGALPEEVGNVTTYGAALLSHAAAAGPAGALVEFMGSPEGRKIFAATGVE